MFCPQCGTEINETARFCSACGTLLGQPTTAEQTPSPAAQRPGLNRPSLAQAATRPTVRPMARAWSAPITPAATPASPVETTPVAPEAAPVVASPVVEQSGGEETIEMKAITPEVIAEQAPLRQSSVPVSAPTSGQAAQESAPPRASRTAPAYDDEDFLPPAKSKNAQRTRTQAGGKAQKKRMSGGKKAMIWVIVLLVLVGAGVGAHFYVQANYTSWERMFKTVFGIGATQVEPATYEATTTAEGQPAHKFTVKGENPDVLIVHTLNNQRITFLNGSATVTIPDSFFLPETPDPAAETLSATVNMAVLDNRGKETPVPCDPITIAVPFASVTNLSPAEPALETTAAKQTLSMTVAVNAKVSVNGADHTAAIASGVFTKEFDLVMGDNVFDITVTAPYARPYTHKITVTRKLPPVAITIKTAPAKRTETGAMTFSGTVEKNSILKLTGSGKLTYTPATGAFSVAVTMNDLGLYEGKLTATINGKGPGEYAYRIERIPVATTYQKAATTPDTAQLFSKMSTYVNKKLKLSGTITSVGTDSFTLTLGEGQTLTFAYYGGTALTVDTAATVYGEVKKITNNVPECYAWFVIQ